MDYPQPKAALDAVKGTICRPPLEYVDEGGGVARPLPLWWGRSVALWRPTRDGSLALPQDVGVSQIRRSSPRPQACGEGTIPPVVAMDQVALPAGGSELVGLSLLS
jgi:hypothetical protein